jgi:pilus assembly protein CpaC
VIVLALVGPLVELANGQPAAAPDDLVDGAGPPVRHIVVTVNKSRTLKFERPFANTQIGAPDIADLLPLTDTTLYVLGKKPGTTNISVFDPNKQLVSVVDLEITPDTSLMRSKIQSSTGSRGITVSSANGQIVLSGEATDAVAAARALDVAKGMADKDATIVNAMKVAEPQQVMLKVRILEVDRNAGRDLGVNWQGSNGKVSGNSGQGAFTTGATTFNGQTTGIGITGTFPGTGGSPFGTLLADIVNTHGVSIDVLLTALETRGLVRSLAEPNLIALSGQKAFFNVGGDIPIPTLSAGQPGTGGTVSTQYYPYGVQLTFTPTVLSDGLIDLNLSPRVTEIDTSQPAVGGVPLLTDRSVNSTVELRDGQSFALAGLLQANSSEAISQLPYLGSLPILGTLFRSTSYQKNETELVVIVTPDLVRPASPKDHLATPFDQSLQSNDIDLFLMGDLERKKKYVDYITAGGDLKGPYGYILDGR